MTNYRVIRELLRGHTVELSDEQQETALYLVQEKYGEFLAANRGCALTTLCNSICETHGANGLWVLEGGGTLQNLLDEIPAEYVPEGFDADEHSMRFLEACGFDQYSEPPHFYWGGTGNCIWLTEIKTDEKSLRGMLQQFLAEAKQEKEDQETLKEYEAELAWDRRDAHDNL